MQKPIPPMLKYEFDSCRVSLASKGSNTYEKSSYPTRYGIYSAIETSTHYFHFNLNDEIIRAAGKGSDWPHPQEWLKRTAGNDWIYYSTGGYTGVFETTGEFYLPNLPYKTNKHTGGDPFLHDAVSDVTKQWHAKLEKLVNRLDDAPDEVTSFLHSALANTPVRLADKAVDLLKISGGRISVLPPDSRHVDYNVIPLTIARGCLYKCGFCRVKNRHAFSVLSKREILEQIISLREIYACDLPNCNSIFLGEHDALHAGEECISYAIEQSFKRLEIGQAYLKGTNIFMFGSATSLLEAPDSLFDSLGNQPGQVYINIGLESADQTTLDILEKPLKSADILKAFDRIQEINDRYPSIEITANFVTDENLAEAHYESLLLLIRNRITRQKSKGCIYLSPLQFGHPSRSKLFDFYRMKRLSRLPLFFYTIQRL